jgi:hypothetical protein
MKKDATTRKSVERGERPLLHPYLVFLVLEVSLTTLAVHGHVMGRIGSVKTSWCCCTAGYAKCVHKAAGLWMQHHHWGEGRNSEAPSTLSMCAWADGGNKMVMDASRGTSNMSTKRSPKTLEEAKVLKERDTNRNVLQGMGRGNIYLLLPSPRRKVSFDDPLCPISS